MRVTPEQLLQHLPPFRNERVLIAKDQKVNDIIEQILKAHEKYAQYYDRIAHYFDADTTEQVCNNINSFIKKHIAYVEEGDDSQTTALPSAILTLKHGDCKHYSSFTAGVLDALKRQGKKIDWCYRFCSYKIIDKTPHHVFVVVKNNTGELWIDAVPGAETLTPLWQLDKTVKTSSMPLYDVVGNPGTNGAIGSTIGWTLAQQIAHAIARTNPVLVLGRGAFLQMVKWNVKAWAKNMDYALQTKGLAFSDPLGATWYKLGGQWQNLMDAINEGKDKRMIGEVGINKIGFTGAEIVAMITAAAPVIIAVTSVIRSAMNKGDFEQGQLLYPTTGTGTTLPTGSGNTIIDTLKNPVVLAVGAGAMYYLYTQSKKRKVSGNDNQLLWLLLLAGGGYMLYKRSQQQGTTTDQELLPASTTEPGAQPISETLPPDMDSSYRVEDESANTYSGGGYGGGGEPYLLKTMGFDTPIEAMM
jgi:hypothetical protein